MKAQFSSIMQKMKEQLTIQRPLDAVNVEQLQSTFLRTETKAEKEVENTAEKEGVVKEKVSDSMKKEKTKPKYNFCAISGSDYVLKVLALYESLKKHSNDFQLWICCIDDMTYETFSVLNLDHVKLIKVNEIEDKRLLAVKKERKVNEYCWTLKAPFIKHLLSQYNLESILYVDGDLFFFSDPSIIFKEWGEDSIYLCPQRDLKWVEQKYGKFQAGLIGFKNDEHGINSVTWRQERCLEFCGETENEGRFGDQKYLDKLPKYFPNVKVSNNLGVDAAPWNCVYNNQFTIRNKKDGVYIENDKLVVFHFACLSILNKQEFDLWSLHKITFDKVIKNNVYLPYSEEIRKGIIRISNIEDGYINYFLSKKERSEVKTYYNYSPLRKRMDQYDTFMNFATIVSKEYIIKSLAFYQSIASKIDHFQLYILCMDSTSYSILSRAELKNVTLVQLQKIENKELINAKKNRNLQEYCWTLKAPFCEYLLKNVKEWEHIIYCDSDLYFFDNPDTILDEWTTYSIFLCKQRGTLELEKTHGMFQAGLIGFKNEKNSLNILKWWREKCIHRCSAIYDETYDSWGDQKYLDVIPNLFSNIKLIDHVGIDAAPWNLIDNNQHKVKSETEKVLIDNSPLIVYHFGSLIMADEQTYDLWKLEKLDISDEIMNLIYSPYIQALKASARKANQIATDEEYKELYNEPPKGYVYKNPITLY